MKFRSKIYVFIFSAIVVAGILLYPKYKRYSELKQRLPDLPAMNMFMPALQAEFPEKTWVHKVNTPEKARMLSGAYRGFEMDIVIDTLSGELDVRHPPDPSTGTTLEKMFSTLPNVSECFFWLDIKNLDEERKGRSLETLLRLANTYGLLKNIIVESQFPERLTPFTEKGFYTSYYIPAFDLNAATEDELKGYYMEIKTHLSQSRVSALSARSESFPFIEKYFPEMDMLLWHLDEEKDFSYRVTLSLLKMKDKIKVVLVK